MNKLFAIVISMVLVVGTLCGCSANSEETISKVGKPVVLTEIDISQFPDAEEYDVYRWPTIGIASEIPAPAWSNRGWIKYDEPDRFYCRVGYTTFDDFSNYISELQEFGFTNNYVNDGEWKYYAETDDGWGIILFFYERNSDMVIQLARDNTTMDKAYVDY